MNDDYNSIITLYNNYYIITIIALKILVISKIHDALLPV